MILKVYYLHIKPKIGSVLTSLKDITTGTTSVQTNTTSGQTSTTR